MDRNIHVRGEVRISVTVERLLIFTVLELEHDMHGQSGRGGGAARREQADRENGEDLALDVSKNV